MEVACNSRIVDPCLDTCSPGWFHRMTSRCPGSRRRPQRRPGGPRWVDVCKLDVPMLHQERGAEVCGKIYGRAAPIRTQVAFRAHFGPSWLLCHRSDTGLRPGCSDMSLPRHLARDTGHTYEENDEECTPDARGATEGPARRIRSARHGDTRWRGRCSIESACPAPGHVSAGTSLPLLAVSLPFTFHGPLGAPRAAFPGAPGAREGCWVAEHVAVSWGGEPTPAHDGAAAVQGTGRRNPPPLPPCFPHPPAERHFCTGDHR